MFWIEGIGRNPSGFFLQTIAPNEGRQTRAMEELSTSLNLGRTTRTRVTTDTATWTPAGSKGFWQVLEIDEAPSADGHGVFKLSHDNCNYFIPVSVFLQAIVRPIQRMHPFLFHPQGLDALCTPLLDCQTPSVGLHQSISKLFGSRNFPPAGQLAALSWMHCFPSARAMFASVYSSALKGRLDCLLPNAQISMILHSVILGKDRLVSNVVITGLEVLEAPYSFANNHTHHIVMHESSALDWTSLHQQSKSAIPPRGEGWHLSDEEWASIEPIFERRGETKFALREILDAILVKLGTGTPWRKLDFKKLNFPIVQATYQRMTKRGQWQLISDILTSTRSH